MAEQPSTPREETEMGPTGLAAYEMVSMVIGRGQLHFFGDPDRARAKAKALQGLVFRLPIFEDYRPRNGAPAGPLPGWANLDPWSGTDLADPAPTPENDYHLYEIEAILTDAGVSARGAGGVAELVGERDGYRDQAAELTARVAELQRERDDALAHLRRATQPPGFSHAQALLDMPPIARAATQALSGPESLGIDQVVPDTRPYVSIPAGYPLGRGLAVPEDVPEERSAGLAFHR